MTKSEVLAFIQQNAVWLVPAVTGLFGWLFKRERVAKSPWLLFLAELVRRLGLDLPGLLKVLKMGPSGMSEKYGPPKTDEGGAK